MRTKRMIIYFGLFLCFIITLMTVISLFKNELPLIDEWMRNGVPYLIGTPIYKLGLQITKLGSRQFLIPFTIFMSAIIILLYRHWLQALFFSLGTLMTYYLHHAIKDIVQRERPSILIEAGAKGFSFPSGHAMISIVCYGLLLYFLLQKISHKQTKIILQLFLSILILFIGLSRYVINVHYITDIIAGFFFGFLLMKLLIFAYEKIYEPH